MSTPERADDPGEHGYGSTGQDVPSDDESGDTSPRLEDDDNRAHEDDEPEPEESRQAVGPPEAD
jgi:hypothetical protein